ncbi:unnamed protein product [Rangifer tarandus platyrhynchus]|uniref:Uncharacterized protein n=1 Tax=Rangifer tarandus platyrhynchus TaxID=3082113 RepID=A0AC59ZFS0_RANTA
MAEVDSQCGHASHLETPDPHKQTSEIQWARLNKVNPAIHPPRAEGLGKPHPHARSRLAKWCEGWNGRKGLRDDREGPPPHACGETLGRMGLDPPPGSLPALLGCEPLGLGPHERWAHPAPATGRPPAPSSLPTTLS